MQGVLDQITFEWRQSRRIDAELQPGARQGKHQFRRLIHLPATMPDRLTNQTAFLKRQGGLGVIKPFNDTLHPDTHFVRIIRGIGDHLDNLLGRRTGCRRTVTTLYAIQEVLLERLGGFGLEDVGGLVFAVMIFGGIIRVIGRSFGINSFGQVTHAIAKRFETRTKFIQ